MGILITKRKQMRKLFIRTLALALCLTGTAQALRAQETTAAQTAAAADQRPKTINEMRQERGLTDTHNLFVPKGQWIFGGTASYSTHTNKGYQFLVIEGINSKGYTFRVSPMIAYAFRDNMAVEVNVGVMGISYTHTKQVHNQVTVGKRNTSMMNFKVNIFSIGLGMAFYL